MSRHIRIAQSTQADRDPRTRLREAQDIRTAGRFALKVDPG